jgi:hypothetical protein
MAIHAMGPYFMKLHYTAADRQHVLNFNVIATGTAGDPETYNLYNFTETPGSPATMIGLLVAVLKPAFHSSGGFNSWELLHKATPEARPEWCAGGVISNGAGTCVGLTSVGVQASYSFHTRGGSRLRVQLMETAHEYNLIRQYGDLEGQSYDKALVDWLLGEDNFMVGRDGTFPGGFISLSTKLNDVLQKKIREP